MRWGLLTPHAIAYSWRRTPRRSRRIGASLGAGTLELPMIIYSGAGGGGLTGTRGMCSVGGRERGSTLLICMGYSLE